MDIIPNRTMSLSGQRVEAGKKATVSKEDGELAIRHRWAIAAKDAKADDTKKAKTE